MLEKPRSAEIVCIGTELLVGALLNTNARFLSRKLAENAIDVYRETTVGDNHERIVDALRLALGRADIVITSGGLGPTEDDVTMGAVASLLNRRRAFHKPTYRYIQDKIKSRHLPMTPLVARQCYLPEGARVLKNRFGTAPGLILETLSGARKKWLVILPGPPRELEPMFTGQALPALIRSARLKRGCFYVRSVRLTGVTEAEVANRVKDLLRRKPPLTVGIYAKPLEVELKIMAKYPSQKKAVIMAGRLEKIIRCRWKEKVFGVNGDTLPSVIGKKLRQSRKTLGLAESCTGGLASHLVTTAPGSSDYFRGSVVVYSNDLKKSLLNIPESVLKKNGAVSGAAAKHMAGNVRRILHTDIGLGITGIAGPSGGSRRKPVGLVFIAIADSSQVRVIKNRFFGTRGEITAAAAHKALDLLRLFK